MGKNNNNKNPLKQKPQQPSFFMMQRQKFGEDWLNRVNSEYIRKNALKIFKDLAYGAANIEVEYKYFMNHDFTYNLAEAAYDNAKYCYACYVGLSSNPAALADAYMVKIAQEHYDRYQVFNTIVMHLNGILKDNACSNSTLVRYYLQEMVAAIRWKKVAFNNGYFITLPKEHDKAYVKQERRQYNDGYKSYQDDSGLKGFFKQPDQTNL